MCEFISWIEYENEVFYLNDDMLFESRIGKDILKESKFCREDITGHGFIQEYYDRATDDNFGTKLYKYGKHKECEYFKNPDNFPRKIAYDLISGKFNKIITYAEIDTEMLKPILASYDVGCWSKIEELIKFKPDVSEEKRKEVIKKIKQITKNQEILLRNYGGKGICKYFLWDSTEDGNSYWNDVSKSCMENNEDEIEKVRLEINFSGAIDIKNIQIKSKRAKLWKNIGGK